MCRLKLTLAALSVVYSLAALSVLLTSTSARAEQQLQARPDKCVSLRQGQVCFQRVRLSWQTATAGDYCLYVTSDKLPLKCWSNASSGNTLYSFASPTDRQFHLTGNDSTSPLAQVRVTVSWVYKSKSRRRRSWRLF
jgi:hypothetical protein